MSRKNGQDLTSCPFLFNNRYSEVSMNSLAKNPKYNQLLEEIKSTITEHVFMSRWTLIEGYWSVGKLIRNFSDGDISELLQHIAQSIEISERTLWYSVKCFDTYNDINKIPEGKNIS